jgi:hypothetical protein
VTKPRFRICRDGLYRLVVLAGPLAIKVPRQSNFAEGRRQNRREAERSPKDRAYCRVRACFFRGLVLVADRADAIGEEEFWRLEAEGAIDELRDRQDPETGRPYSICQEPNWRNIGRTTDGRLVVIDYGDEEEGT